MATDKQIETQRDIMQFFHDVIQMAVDEVNPEGGLAFTLLVTPHGTGGMANIISNSPPDKISGMLEEAMRAVKQAEVHELQPKRKLDS